jgi:ribose transport system substrate-binding protein
MRRRILLACLPLCLIFAFSSCTRPVGEAIRREKPKVIGVSLLTRAHVFYRDLEEGLRQAAARHNFRLIVDAGEWDLARHQAHIENFIVQRVDAIIVCPSDSRGIGPAIERANQAGIPVFTADIQAFGGRVVSHIASDNVQGGRLAAQYLARALNGKGNVAIIDQPYVKSTIDRVAGFEAEMKKHPGIRIIAKPNGDGVRDRAMKTMEDLLQSSQKMNAVFGINDDSALGALAAIEAAGRKDIIVVGYDAIPEARNAIARGSSLKADVVQHPRRIGDLTIETIAKFFRNEPVPALIPVEVELVDAASLSAR